MTLIAEKLVESSQVLNFYVAIIYKIKPLNINFINNLSIRTTFDKK